MRVDSDEPTPGTTTDALRWLASSGKEFLDWVSAFTPPLVDLIPEERLDSIRIEGRIYLDHVVSVVEMAQFDLDDWRDHQTLVTLIPAFIALEAGVKAIDARWQSLAPGAFRVDPGELEAVRLGVEAIRRWRDRLPPSPPGWRLVFHDGKLLRFRDRMAYVRVEHEPTPRVILDTDTVIKVTPGIADYFQALLDAQGDPVIFDKIKGDPRYPDLPANQSRLREAIGKLAPVLSERIEHVEGYRLRGFGA